MDPLRLALSNDYEIVLQGLRAMLDDFTDQVRVVDIDTDGDPDDSADVILYDTFGQLPDEDTQLQELIGSSPAKVVVYSWEIYPEHVARQLGAAGYLHKGASAAEFVDAITAVHLGQPTPSGASAEESTPSWPGIEHGLTMREAEVIALVAQGLSNQEIAERSFLSINTVKTYLRTGYAKIGTTNRAQAVAWAITHGLGPR